MRPTRSGNICAYTAPITVPYENPTYDERVVAERGTKPVEVAGHVAAPDLGQPRAVARDAPRDEVDGFVGAVVERPQVSVGVRRRVVRVQPIRRGRRRRTRPGATSPCPEGRS